MVWEDLERYLRVMQLHVGFGRASEIPGAVAVDQSIGGLSAGYGSMAGSTGKEGVETLDWSSCKAMVLGIRTGDRLDD